MHTNKEKTILGIVILFNPDIDDAIKNISQYIEYIDKLIVWDNSPVKQTREYIRTRIAKIPKTVYMTQGKNVGISIALNASVQILKEEGYDYLLTMDQDSYWINFLKYKETCLSINKSNIGGFSPNINGAFKDNEIATIDHRTITSGSLIPKHTYIVIGNYNDRFFVDGIDVEFRCRLEKNNYNFLRINAAILKQKYGENIIRKPWGYPAPEYPSFRLYGILYSHIWIMRHYKLSIKVIYIIIVIYILQYTFDVVFYQSNKIEKISAICKGIWDGSKN